MANNTAALLNETTESGTMNSFGERFLAGEHFIAIDKFEIKEVFHKGDQEKMVMVGCDFIVLDSDTMKPGTRVSDPFYIGRRGTKGETQRKKLNGVARAVVEALGVSQKPEDVGGKEFNKLVAAQLTKMLEIDANTGYTVSAGRKFTGRGLALRVISRNNVGKDGKTYVNQDYTPVKQTKEDIKAKRAAIEAVPSAPAAAAPKTDSAAPAPAPAPITPDVENMLDGIDLD